MNDLFSKVRLALALFIFICAGSRPCEAATDSQIPLAIQQTFREGLEALYNTRYDRAESIFRSALEREPNNYVLLFGVTCVDWWRMENTFPPPGSPEGKLFAQDAKAAIKAARKELGGPHAAVAYLCLGGDYGLQGRLEAARHHWWTAYVDGRRAYIYQKKALELDPTLYDAYLGVGAFDYFISTLPHLYRVLTFLHLGDRATGLRELHLAADQSLFSRTAAQMLLVGINWNFEKNPKEAWAILEKLSEEYPRSPFVGFLRLIGLYRLNDAMGLHKEAEAYLLRIDRKEPYYKPDDRIQGFLLLGLSDQLLGHYRAALESYNRVLGLLPPHHPARGATYLFIGECQDLMGQHPIAHVFYHKALKEPRLWGDQAQARRLLKTPFLVGDDPLPHEFAIKSNDKS